MPILDVTPAPAEVAASAPVAETTIADFADARRLERWQRDVLAIHARAARLGSTAPLDVLEQLLHDALHGRI